MTFHETPANWPCGWLRMDARGTVLAANATLGRLLGAAPEALRGEMFDALLSGPTRLLYHSYLQPLLRMHGNVQELSLTLKASDGSPVDVLFYSARSADPPGADHIDVVLAPIRRRRGIEDEMLRIKRAADQSPGLIFQLMQSAEGGLCFPYVSDAVRRLYGTTPELARRSADAVLGCIHPADREQLLASLRACAAAGLGWSGVFRVTRADGSLRSHEMHASPRRLDLEVLVWHGHIADVTEQHELECNLAEREAADRASRVRSEILARISHELRTPLNAIIGFSTLLRGGASGDLNEAQRHQLGVILSSGRHLLGLVNQVLDISAAEASPLGTELEAVPLAPAILEAMDLLRTQADVSGVHLRPLACDRALQAMAHPQHLRQVLVNLLSNAVKYNRRGGEVAITVSRPAEPGLHPHQVAVAVKDTGPGLSLEQQAQLFQAFNRLGAQHTEAEGTGLGLVITQQLLAQMNGSIEVHSTLGAGSTFTVLLPLAADVAPVTGAVYAVEGDESSAPVLPAHTEATRGDSPEAFRWRPSSAGSATRGRILYVEDNSINILLMEAIVGLRPEVVLESVPNGGAALEALGRQRPDLLLLDMHLPDTTGPQLLTQLRELDGMRGVAAVAVSAAARSEDITAAMAHGFDDYWTKPLHVDRTLAEIDRWLMRSADSLLPGARR